MSPAAATAYHLGFTGRIAPARSRRRLENKALYRYQSTLSEKAHCIKDSVLLNKICGSGGILAGTKSNSEVIWSEQRSI